MGTSLALAVGMQPAASSLHARCCSVLECGSDHRCHITQVRRQLVTNRDVPRAVAPTSSADLSPCIGLETDAVVTFLASWKIPRSTAPGPGGTHNLLSSCCNDATTFSCRTLGWLCFARMILLEYCLRCCDMGVADPPLDIQVIQFDTDGQQIEGGFLDSSHPRTEWKHPVRSHSSAVCV